MERRVDRATCCELGRAELEGCVGQCQSRARIEIYGRVSAPIVVLEVTLILLEMVLQLLIMAAALAAACYGVGTLPLSFSFSSMFPHSGIGHKRMFTFS